MLEYWIVQLFGRVLVLILKRVYPSNRFARSGQAVIRVYGYSIRIIL